MITLYTFGAQLGLPDPSPFVMKADVLLKMSGVPYATTLGDRRRAPKGKLPYIEDAGNILADSTFIRLHLERKHGVDFDKHLSPTEKGVAWAVEKMLEDQLYWVVIHERWMIDANFRKGPATFFKAIPAPLRAVIVPMIRRQVRRNLHGHGLGRHSRDEIVTLGKRAIDALAAVLGDKPYLMDAHVCGADATAFAFVISLLSPLYDTQLLAHTESHKNLVAYCDRMTKEFYPGNTYNQRAVA